MNPEEITHLQGIWADYCDRLRDCGSQLFRAQTPSDDLTAAEGLRHLSRLTRLGLLAQVEFSDPDYPVLARYVDDVTKFGCDNPDTIYQRAIINGAHEYRITGIRGTIDYLSFITAFSDAEGKQQQVGQIDTKTLTVDSDGRFEIMITHDPVPGNWLRLTPETKSVSVRQTYLDRAREVPADLRIERLDSSSAPALLTIDQIAAKLTAAAGYTRYCASLFTDWTQGYQAHANSLPPADQEACLRAGGDPNIYFYRSFWELGPDEALVVRIARIPECDTWNLQVDNYWQESMDYRYHRSNVNRHSAQPNADGSVTIVIAHRDPGHPNWLSTAGHRLGHFAMRWIRAAEHVDPQTQLCRFDDLPAILGTPGATG